MNRDNIYTRAKNNGCEFESTCVGISQMEWDKLMKGATKANRKEVVRIALLDNMPESFHGGENYSKSESCIEEMDKIIEGLETIASEIDDIPSSDDLLNVI